MKPPKSTSFTFADLFAGIGGMRIGFELAGGECLFTSEIDEKALKTYFANFLPGEGHKVVRDVLKVEPSDLIVQGHPPDVIVAGFPCQPYSIAGLRRGLTDDRGGQIFKSLVRIIGAVRPGAFLLENVKGILSHDSGATFKFMMDQLSEQNYYLRYQSLNSMRHANVPQNRERVFIVGFSDPTQAAAFSFPEETPLTRSFRELLESDNHIPETYFYDERYPAFSEIRAAVTQETSVYQWRRHYVRENKAGVCPTLTANMGSGGHNVPLIKTPRGIRKLTPREVANLQGFPEGFILPEISSAHLYHQFGNSVTVPLIEKIALQMRLQLKGA